MFENGTEQYLHIIYASPFIFLDRLYITHNIQCDIKAMKVIVSLCSSENRDVFMFNTDEDF